DSAELAATVEEPGVGGAYRADQAIPGSLEQIAFRRLPPVVHGADDVEIAVQASSLNFKDVMNAMGLLPSSVVAGGLTEHRLGLEVAGRVLRTGPLVKHIQPGDDVIARVAEGFCGRVVANGKYVFPRPKQLTAQQAAAIPLVYVTAWYSLFHLARIIRGETVLIHSAAGGVGFAAIQLARRAGATVIATAGSEEKREWLRQLGIEHVFDSRTLDFYNKVIDVTGGRGVDIVLNSLTGRFIAQGMKCLAPFGRFIELGKVDIYRNSKLGLERLGENISYFVVDVDRLAVHKPELHRQILSEVIDLFASGDLQPHEITEFQISDLPLALKFMIRASYRGKIVLNMEQDTVPTLPARNASFRSDRSYLISAGASGFGLEIAQWMLNCGARCFVLLSRSGPKSDEDRKTIELMRERGARILLPQVDVADQNAVRQVMEQIRGELPPLAGVIHGAAVMDDATIPNIDMARFERVFRPKAQGAWSLHEATVDAGFCLDFFVMLSSVSSALGLYGQVNYAAANYFLDALAQYRQLKGLPGTSINLGILGQYAGLSKTLNEGQDVIGLVESQGLLVTPLSHILAKLDATIVQQPVQRMTGRFDWIKFRAAYPHLARDSRFVDLLSDAALARGSRSKRASLRDTLSELDSEQQIQRLQEELAGALARILDVLPEKLDVTASIDSFGLDSLALTSLQIGIVRSLDINVPLIKLLKGPSIATLAIDLAVQLTESAAGESVGDAAETGAAFTLADLEGVHVLSPWLIRGSSSASASIRLICFHSMGVGASLFTKFLLNPPDDFDILAVQTPGRENRLAEPAAESVMELVDEIAPMLHPLFDRPVIIWGHSFGGVVAWEVIRRLRDEFQLDPKHFVVTGTAAPPLIERWQNREVLLKS
ncbi:MAG TPA: SDR family NAD(P)-dependent oxidoreductase, partial [Planctomycetaceae bacterium]|nr:SDR family NAD(P)-dependent oxidoreductase [Planctomycetaceae bacterium]